MFGVAHYECDISDPKPPHPLLGLAVLLPFSYLAVSVPNGNLNARTMRERSLFPRVAQVQAAIRVHGLHKAVRSTCTSTVESWLKISQMAENPPVHV